MEKIQMQHIDPSKKTVAMEKETYDTLKASFIKSLKAKKEATFKELLTDVTDDLKKNKKEIKGSVQWNLAWVQIDMEAKNELLKNTETSPQKLSLK